MWTKFKYWATGQDIGLQFRLGRLSFDEAFYRLYTRQVLLMAPAAVIVITAIMLLK